MTTVFVLKQDTVIRNYWKLRKYMFDYKEMKKLMFLNEVLKYCGDT